MACAAVHLDSGSFAIIHLIRSFTEEEMFFHLELLNCTCPWMFFLRISFILLPGKGGDPPRMVYKTTPMEKTSTFVL